MLDTEWQNCRAEIEASWPSLARVLARPETERVWRMSLAPGNAAVLHAAVTDLRARLAEDGNKTTPVLGAFEAAVRKEARRRNAEARTESDAPERSMSLAEWEAIRIAEAKAYADNNPDDPRFDLGQRIAEIRAEGPFLQRINGLLDGSDTRSLDEWWAETFKARGGRIVPGPQSLRDIIGDPSAPPVPQGGADLALPPEPDLEDADVELAGQVQREAEAIVAAMKEHGSRSIDWHTVPVNVRERCREIVASEKAARQEVEA